MDLNSPQLLTKKILLLHGKTNRSQTELIRTNVDDEDKESNQMQWKAMTNKHLWLAWHTLFSEWNCQDTHLLKWFWMVMLVKFWVKHDYLSRRSFRKSDSPENNGTKTDLPSSDCPARISGYRASQVHKGKTMISLHTVSPTAYFPRRRKCLCWPEEINLALQGYPGICRVFNTLFILSPHSRQLNLPD